MQKNLLLSKRTDQAGWKYTGEKAFFMLHLGNAKLAKSYFANDKRNHKFSSGTAQITAISFGARNSASLYTE